VRKDEDAMKCKNCNGFGYWLKSTGWRDDQEEKIVCQKCDGTGKTQ